MWAGADEPDGAHGRALYDIDAVGLTENEGAEAGPAFIAADGTPGPRADSPERAP